MKFIPLIFILTFSLACFGQQKHIKPLHSKTLKKVQITTFIESIKKKLFLDTSKFNRLDLVHTSMGTQNIKPYSPIFCVNMRYTYKLDIIDGTLVQEFVDNILNPSNILSVHIANTSASVALFGTNGLNGAIFITMKKNAKVNFKVAGISVAKKTNHGNNFDQRKDGEIKIAH